MKGGFGAKCFSSLSPNLDTCLSKMMASWMSSRNCFSCLFFFFVKLLVMSNERGVCVVG